MSLPSSRPSKEAIPADGTTTPISARKPVTTSLERKLELLEARFTMPAPFPSASAPAATTDTKSPSEATLGPYSSPNASASAHSFGFGTPSLSNLSSNPTNLGMHNMHNNNNDNSQPLPTGSIRNKRRRQSWTNNLHVVTLAAEKHMRRVAASSSSPTPLQQQEQQEREQQLSAATSRLGAGSPSQLSNRMGAGSPSQLSVASESNQTLITGHLRPKNTNPEKQTATAKPTKAAKGALVVQESPPIMTPAGVAQQSLPRSDAVRAAVANTTTTATTSENTSTNSGTVRYVVIMLRYIVPCVVFTFLHISRMHNPLSF
jgi:hypothetical protein